MTVSDNNYEMAKAALLTLKQEKESLELEKRAIELKINVLKKEIDRNDEIIAVYEQQQNNL